MTLQYAELNIPINLNGQELRRVENVIWQYISPRHDPYAVAEDITGVLEEIMEQKMRTKKTWLKAINEFDDPSFCEALIIQLEAKRRQLKAEFTSETPRG